MSSPSKGFFATGLRWMGALLGLGRTSTPSGIAPPVAPQAVAPITVALSAQVDLPVDLAPPAQTTVEAAVAVDVDLAEADCVLATVTAEAAIPRLLARRLLARRLLAVARLNPRKSSSTAKSAPAAIARRSGVAKPRVKAEAAAAVCKRRSAPTVTITRSARTKVVATNVIAFRPARTKPSVNTGARRAA